MSAGESLSAVVTRNAYYKDGYRTLLRIALIEAVAIALLIVALMSVFSLNKAEPVYFATTSDGRLIQLVPLNQPNLTTSAVLTWAVQATTETMTFGFHDYRQRLQESSRHFTRTGWESFTGALQQSRVIEAVEQRRQVVTAVAQGAPVIIEEGIAPGNRYRWVIELPLLVTYQSGNRSQPNRLMVTIVIVRVPSLENPNGIGIEQWIAVAS